ncbi:hypothetical protein [Neorhizobium petrolearium]|uniref:hypothetical protein n=1 Tax=Neorhizobium petrolearium TaxID=515361 RepID=UPI003F15A296
MKTIIAMTGLAVMLAGCNVYTGSFNTGPGLEPIPGSITYGGQPRTRLTRAPVGSVVPHQFRNQLGQRVDETYIIQPDRSLKLVDRRVCRSPFCDE